MEQIEFTIDGTAVSCSRDAMLLEAALERGFDIPALCHHEAEPPYGACRLCLVEITDGDWTSVEASCTYPVRKEGIEVKTDSERLRRYRRLNMELLLARCPQSEKVREMARRMGVERVRLPRQEGEGACVLCGLCVAACEHVGVGGISFVGRGPSRRVATPYDEPAEECIGCAACAEICPTGHITIEDRDGVREVHPFGMKCELVRCPKCGRGYVTKKQLEFLRTQLPEKSEFLEGCPVCKGRRRARELQKIYEKLTTQQQQEVTDVS